MAAQIRWRRRRRQGPAGIPGRLLPLLALGLAAGALGFAPAALAAPAAARPAGLVTNLLPSVLPSVCVGGVVLCHGSVVALPTPPPVPLPSACVPGVVCTGDVVTTPSATPTSPPPTQAPSPRATPVGGGGPGPVPGGGGGPGAAAVAVVAPLPAPPGVVPVPAPRSSVDGGINPDTFANLLSLSLRDGLGSAGTHVWPWLLGIQLTLWMAIALVVWWRQPTSRAGAPRA